MKRCNILIGGLVLTGLALGCSNDKKNEQAASDSTYKLLKGDTSDGSESWNNSPEPALNANTRFAAGQLAETQGKLDCAIAQYDQAIRLDPKHVPSLYRQGVALTKAKKYTEAIEVWEKYIKVTRNDASGYSNLGFTYEMAADPDNAEKSYKKGLSIDSKNVACRVNYGLMLARNNRNDEAEAQLLTVLKPDEVAYNLATIYEQQGAVQQARAEYEKALAANPRNMAAQRKLASLPPADLSEASVSQEPLEGAAMPAPQPMEPAETPEEVKAPTEQIDQ